MCVGIPQWITRATLKSWKCSSQPLVLINSHRWHPTTYSIPHSWISVVCLSLAGTERLLIVWRTMGLWWPKSSRANYVPWTSPRMTGCPIFSHTSRTCSPKFTKLRLTLWTTLVSDLRSQQTVDLTLTVTLSMLTLIFLACDLLVIYFADAHTARIANMSWCRFFAYSTVVQRINSLYVFLQFLPVFPTASFDISWNTSHFH